jgi:hypothetical protein
MRPSQSRSSSMAIGWYRWTALLTPSSRIWIQSTYFSSKCFSRPSGPATNLLVPRRNFNTHLHISSSSRINLARRPWTCFFHEQMISRSVRRPQPAGGMTPRRLWLLLCRLSSIGWKERTRVTCLVLLGHFIMIFIVYARTDSRSRLPFVEPGSCLHATEASARPCLTALASPSYTPRRSSTAYAQKRPSFH